MENQVVYFVVRLEKWCKKRIDFKIQRVERVFSSYAAAAAYRKELVASNTCRKTVYGIHDRLVD